MCWVCDVKISHREGGSALKEKLEELKRIREIASYWSKEEVNRLLGHNTLTMVELKRHGGSAVDALSARIRWIQVGTVTGFAPRPVMEDTDPDLKHFGLVGG